MDSTAKFDRMNNLQKSASYHLKLFVHGQSAALPVAARGGRTPSPPPTRRHCFLGYLGIVLCLNQWPILAYVSLKEVV